MTYDRCGDIKTNLELLKHRIETACSRSDRDPREVCPIIVTKTYPLSDLTILAELGVLHVGESRDQEASEKWRQYTDKADFSNLTWHFIGQLQTNKANSVARYAHVVHSVDRLRLVNALSRGARHADRELGVMIQLSLDSDASRGGVDCSKTTDAVEKLAEQIDAAANLRLDGVMAVAPRTMEPRRAFNRVREVSDVLKKACPQADAISAGMSGDFEEAIAAGATHVRVGSMVLGSRATVG